MEESTRTLAQKLLDSTLPPLTRRMALAKTITLMETKHAQRKLQADLLLTHLLRHSPNSAMGNDNTFRIGLAGPPGAGKSSMMEALGMYLLEDANKSATQVSSESPAFDYLPDRLAVVCIDPSSSVSGGSILGDKTRMTLLSRHDRAFVRPSANAGVVGGLAAYTDDVVSTCHAAGYPLVLVETVGLGQSEIEVAQSVDMLLLLLPPGGGDELQGVKKGIMEVANLLCVTKADGTLLPAAKHTAADYKAALKFFTSREILDNPEIPLWKPPVLMTSSKTGIGMEAIWKQVCKYRNYLIQTGLLQRQRQRQAKYWMWKHFQMLVQQHTRNDPRISESSRQLELALRHHQVTPRVAATQLLQTLLEGSNYQ